MGSEPCFGEERFSPQERLEESCCMCTLSPTGASVKSHAGSRRLHGSAKDLQVGHAASLQYGYCVPRRVFALHVFFCLLAAQELHDLRVLAGRTIAWGPVTAQSAHGHRFPAWEVVSILEHARLPTRRPRALKRALRLHISGWPPRSSSLWS